MKNKYNSLLKKSFNYNYLQSFLSKTISFVSSIILARLLFVEDFGLILAANTLSSLINIFSNVGLTSYYFQKKTNSKSERKSLIATTLVATILLFLIVFFLKISISIVVKYYFDETIGNMLFIYSFGLLLSIPISLHTVILQKDFNFKTISYGNFYKDLFSSTLKCLFAFSGLGPISVALGDVLGKIPKIVVFLVKSENLPNLKSYKKSQFKKIIFFGKHGFLISFFSVLNNQLDKIFFTFVYTPLQLGLFNFGSQNGGLITQLVSVPQRKLMTSYLIDKKDDLEFFKKKLFSISRLIVLVTWFFSFLFYLNAEIFIEIFFGNKWMHALPFLKLFIISGLISAFFFSSNSLLIVFGLPQIISKLKMVKLPIFIGVLLFSYFFKLDIYYTSFIYIIFNFTMIFVQQIVSFKKTNISIFDFYVYLFPAIFTLTFAIIIWYFFAHFMTVNLSFIFKNTVFCFSYFGIVLLFYKDTLLFDYNLMLQNESS